MHEKYYINIDAYVMFDFLNKTMTFNEISREFTCERCQFFIIIKERVNIFISDEEEKMFIITCQNIGNRILHIVELSFIIEMKGRSSFIIINRRYSGQCMML
jgi:DNA-directed RNA polymerase subunit RPC12/RpoP